MAALTEERGCFMCGGQEVTKKWCGRCQTAWYCGVECQKSDWKRHKSTCDAIVAATKPAGSSTKPLEMADPTSHPASSFNATVRDYMPASDGRKVEPPEKTELPLPRKKQGISKRDQLLTFTRAELECGSCDNVVVANNVCHDVAMSRVFHRYRACCGSRWCDECETEFQEEECEVCGTPKSTSHFELLSRLQARRDSQTPISDGKQDACYCLGAALTKGNMDAGVDLSTATAMFKEAAELDDSRAIFALASTSDDDKVGLLRRAAGLGHIRALHDLALALAETDRPEAVRLMVLAQDAGLAEATEKLETLNALLAHDAGLAEAAESLKTLNALPDVESKADDTDSNNNNSSSNNEPTMELLD